MSEPVAVGQVWSRGGRGVEVISIDEPTGVIAGLIVQQGEDGWVRTTEGVVSTRTGWRAFLEELGLI